MKIKDSTGQEIEVFTPQEVETKAKEIAEKAIETYKAEHPDQTQVINEKETALRDAQEKLRLAEEAAAGSETEQVKRLRRERDAAQENFTKGVSSLKKDFDEFRTSIIGDTKAKLLDAASQGNIEIRKKIEFEFENYKPNDNTPAGIQERIAVAMQIVTGRKPSPSALDNLGASQRGGGSGYTPSSQAKEINENTRKIGEAFGISDEDRKWYSEKFSSKNKPLK